MGVSSRERYPNREGRQRGRSKGVVLTGWDGCVHVRRRYQVVVYELEMRLTRLSKPTPGLLARLPHSLQSDPLRQTGVCHGHGIPVTVSSEETTSAR